MAAEPMDLEAFHTAVLDRFRHRPEPMSADALIARLDPGVFKQFVEMSELLEQVRLISDALVASCPGHDADLLAQQKEVTFEAFNLWQRSILDLPQAYIEVVTVER